MAPLKLKKSLIYKKLFSILKDSSAKNPKKGHKKKYFKVLFQNYSHLTRYFQLVRCPVSLIKI